LLLYDNVKRDSVELATRLALLHNLSCYKTPFAALRSISLSCSTLWCHWRNSRPAACRRDTCM